MEAATSVAGSERFAGAEQNSSQLVDDSPGRVDADRESSGREENGGRANCCADGGSVGIHDDIGVSGSCNPLVKSR